MVAVLADGELDVLAADKFKKVAALVRPRTKEVVGAWGEVVDGVEWLLKCSQVPSAVRWFKVSGSPYVLRPK